MRRWLRAIPAALRDGALYAAAIAIARVSAIFLLPLLTRRLSRTDFGVYAVVSAALLLLQYVSGFGLDTATTRWFYEYRSDEQQATTLATWVWFQIAAGTVLCVIGVLAAPVMADLAFHGRPSATSAIRMAFVALPLTVVPLIVPHWYRVRQRSGPAVVFSTVTSIATVALSVALVGVGHAGLVGVFGAQAATGAAASAVGLYVMRRQLHFSSYSTAWLRDMLRYALPIMPSVGAPLFLAVLTRVLINGLADTDVVGEYQVVAMLASGAALFTQALQQAWDPFALSAEDRVGRRPMYRLALLGYCVMSGVLLCLIASLGPVALRIAGPDYGGLTAELVILSASILIAGAMPIVNTGAAIVGNGRPALVAMVAAFVLNIVFAVALVPSHGLLGAVWAALLAAVLTVPVHLVLAERVWHIGFPIVATVAAGAAGAAFAVAVAWLSSATDVPRVLGSLGLSGVAAVLGLGVLVQRYRTSSRSVSGVEPER